MNLKDKSLYCQELSTRWRLIPPRDFPQKLAKLPRQVRDLGLTQKRIVIAWDRPDLDVPAGESLPPSISGSFHKFRFRTHQHDLAGIGSCWGPDAHSVQVCSKDFQQLLELVDAAAGGKGADRLRMIQEEVDALLRRQISQRCQLELEALLGEPGQITSKSREDLRLVEI